MPGFLLPWRLRRAILEICKQGGKVGIWDVKGKPQVFSISMLILVLKESGKTVSMKLSTTSGRDYIVISFSQMKYLLSLKPQFGRLAKLHYPSELVMIPPDCLVELCCPGPYSRN